VQEGAASGDPMLVVVSAPKIDRLRQVLGEDAAGVVFADMDDVGTNPACIIPVWRDFVADHATDGQRVRGIGEPIWVERSPAELVECQRHESLLNLAFDAAPPWRLRCPYDVASLPAAVIDEARRSHPYLTDGDALRPSTDYRGLDPVTSPFDVPLPDPPAGVAELPFELGPLAPIRAFVSREATRAGLSATESSDLVLAANEVVTNSIRYGGGTGVLRMWSDGDTTLCEVRDGGHLDDALVGRRRPAHDQIGGRGLWLVNQLCDLVQVRTFATGNVVRLHLNRR